ncbi:MAG: tetratricopeptide repeat protein, partial [Bacteroidota bacterium]
MSLPYQGQSQIDSTAYFEAEQYFEQMVGHIRKIQADSAIWAGEKSIDGFTEFEAWSTLAHVNILIANCYSSLQDKESYFRQVAYTTKFAEEKLADGDIMKAFAYNNQAIVYNLQEDYEQAISYCNKALAMDSLSDDVRGTFYSNLGLNYRMKGDYAEAARYYRYGVERIRKVIDRDEENTTYLRSNLAKAINKLGKAVRLQKKYVEALSYYQQVDSLYRFLKIDKVYKSRIDCAHSMAYCYLGLGQTSSASSQLDIALSLQSGREAYQEEVREEILGEIAFSEGANNQARSHLQKALEISQQKKKPSENLIRLIQRLAEVQLQDGNKLAAQKQLEEGIRLIASGDATQAENFIYPSLGIPLLAQIARLQTEMGKDEPVRLDSALQLYQRLQSLVRYHRNSFRADNSRLFLASETLPIYEQAIALCYQLYQQKKSAYYLEEAFAFSELGKATLLQESLKSDAAGQHLSVPDSLRQQERKLQRDIAFYKEQLFLLPPETTNESDSSQQAIWEKKVFALENDYLALTKRLELEYPAYYQTKYSFTTPTISQVQAYLGAGQMLFEYYWGDSDLYVFRIRKSELALQQLPIDAKLEAALVQCREFLGRPTASEAEMKQFQVDAHHLYTVLIDNLP